MRKIVLFTLFAGMAIMGANAQNYEWVVGNDEVNFPEIAGYSGNELPPVTIQGLTITSNVSNTNMGQTETAGPVTFEEVSYPRRFKFNGAGYGSANAADELPPANMPTQRFLSFEVNGNCTVTLIGTTGSNSSSRKIFLTDGADYIGTFDFPGLGSTTLFKGTVEYTGGAATLYLFCNAACSLYRITVVGGEAAINPVNVTKEVCSEEYYDLLGKKLTNGNIKNTLLIKKTTYIDGSSSSSKFMSLY
jgi:hypothetical protein